MNTEILSKNGSIFGKIPRKNKKTATMSSNSSLSSHHDSDGYSSDDSFSLLSRGMYMGQSPRASPPTTSRAGSASASGQTRTRTRTLRERLAPPSEQTEVSAAIARYRAQTIRAHRPATREAAAASITALWESREREREREQQRRLRELLQETAPSRRRNISNPGSEASEPSSPPSTRSSSSSRSSQSSSRSGAMRGRTTSPIVGEPSYLGPVTRDFLRSARLTRRRDDDGEGCGLESVEGESFFPTPKVTFMIDRPQGLTCQICQTATLEMPSPSSPSSPSSSSSSSADNTPDSDTRAVKGRGKRCATVAPAILPCGHLGCHDCLEQWVSAHHSCPFCRQEMRHKGCGHTVGPRAITHRTVHELPRTTAEGGSIGDRCRDCRIEDAQTAALRKWEELAEDLRRARRRVRELSSSVSRDHSETGGKGRKEAEMNAAKEALKQYEAAFEAAPSRSLLEKVTFVDASW
ncbi:hypothetical protein SLS62_003988 [Diatrype stigma]|uniref:RING-type domain-containing protein n=1 Tax=Diatrype stigma TaxID=117547 RepID=A0AAN9YTL8_9PEZI